ncbi:MAG: acyl-CoA dehydrogenase [Rhodobacter sp.]|nr:acyl-CoA dehydrogenase [Paracoccaceae bacterium]MCC0076576.1 acyl-CoA dehydrogenase [Rhodobacter sp.]
MDSDDLKPEDFFDAALAAMQALPTEPRARAAHLAEAGLTGVLAPEAVGGMALPLAFAVPVAQAAGRALLPVPLSETMLLARALAPVAPDLAAALCTGEAAATLQGAGGAALSDTCTHAVLETGAVVTLADAEVTPLGALDLELPLARISGGTVVARLDPAAMAALTRDARALACAEILGAAETCMQTVVDHTTTRVQFGRPLIALQAVRHALARQKLALEGLRHALRRSLGDTGEARSGTTAFLAATQGGVQVAEGAIQLHGGMGFTWDVPLHRYLRRIRRIEAQQGTPALASRLAADFIAELA